MEEVEEEEEEEKKIIKMKQATTTHNIKTKRSMHSLLTHLSSFKSMLTELTAYNHHAFGSCVTVADRGR